MVHTIKQSKPYDEQTYEERAADAMRFLHEMKALYEAKPKAEVVEFPDRLSAAELWRRQAALDVAQERMLEAKRELAERQARTCHRGPQDPDWSDRREY
jgi:hypothetical protein